MTVPLPAALYLRVSTARQAEHERRRTQANELAKPLGP